jgi:signal transduction histidine kinase
MSERVPLRRRFVVAVTGVSAVAVLVFAGIVLFSVHRQAHRQTDAMLAQMVRTEADGVIREFAEHGIHVHDTTVTLPTVGGLAAQKYAFAYGPDCRVLATTANVTARKVPEAWCQRDVELGDHRIFETDAMAEPTLRAASFVARQPDGRPVVFVSALRHDLVDRSVWRTGWLAGALALLVVLAVAGVSAWVARRLTADICRLSEACQTVPEDVATLEESEIRRRFDLPDDAPRELGTLAATIRQLIGKLRRMIHIQNRFIAEAAHELRTPLTALQGDLELSLRRQRSAEEYRQALARAKGDAGRLAELTEQLLEVARTQSDAVVSERVCLSEVVRESLHRFEGPLAEAGIEVSFEAQLEERPEVVADEMSVSRVVDNLLDNAVAHSGADRLELVIREGEPVEGVPTVALHVRDDGVGLDEAEIEGLFAPFHRRSKAEGHGLGLYLARRLVRSHGGELVLGESDDAGLTGAHWVARFRRWTAV